MNDQSNSHKSASGYKAQGAVNEYGYQTMQRVKPDTASCRIINRIGQQVIEIDDHGRGHD